MSTEAAKVLEQAIQTINNNNQATNVPANKPHPTTSNPPPVSTAAPTAVDPSKDPQISSKLEVLARREQAALQAERSAAAKAKELEAREAKIKEFESLKETNPLKALELLGLNYDDMTKIKLLDGELPPEVKVKKVEERLNSFEDAQKQREQDQATQAKKDAEAAEVKAIGDFKSDINQFLSDNSARYELIQFEGQQDLVFEVIDEHYNRTIDPATGIGKVMTKAEASDKVEQWLEQKYDKSRNLKKVSALLGLRQEAPKPTAVKPDTNRQPPKTLTNNISASQSKPRTTPVSDEERIQRAIAYAKGLRPAA